MQQHNCKWSGWCNRWTNDEQYDTSFVCMDPQINDGRFIEDWATDNSKCISQQWSQIMCSDGTSAARYGNTISRKTETHRQPCKGSVSNSSTKDIHDAMVHVVHSWSSDRSQTNVCLNDLFSPNHEINPLMNHQFIFNECVFVISVVRCRLTTTKTNESDGWITLKMDSSEYHRIEGSLLTKIRALYFDFLRNKKVSFTNAVSKAFENLSIDEINEWFPPGDSDIMATV